MVHHLPLSEVALRVLCSFAAGFVIGLERESRGRPAGLRTTILTCVTASLAMIISGLLFVQSGEATPLSAWRPDPARLAAGILTGIGFLGAGTIMRHENFVMGVTTAATLWFVTVVGLAFGAGYFGLGAAGTAIALVVLFLLPGLEKHLPSDAFAELTVTATFDGPDEIALRKRIEDSGAKILGMRMDCSIEKRQRTLVWDLKLKRPDRVVRLSRLVSELAECPGVLDIRWT
jgi:putative Mg2+ transporter-C (MgtC) family protein